MFGALPEWLVDLVVMILMGISIKWLDDHLDSEFDICRGERTLAVRMGRACFAYGTLLAVVAVALNHSLAAALFLSSYAVGMMSNWTERLPTRLPAYVETILAVGLAVLLCGWRIELWALCFVALVDWLDDITDYHKDGSASHRNLARRIGLPETTILTLMALLGSIWLNPEWTLIGFVAFSVVTVISELTVGHLWVADEEEDNHVGHH